MFVCDVCMRVTRAMYAFSVCNACGHACMLVLMHGIYAYAMYVLHVRIYAYMCVICALANLVRNARTDGCMHACMHASMHVM